MPQRCDKGTKVCNKLEKNDPVFAGQRCEVASDCKGKYYSNHKTVLHTRNLFNFPLNFPSLCFTAFAAEKALSWNLINIKENRASYWREASNLSTLSLHFAYAQDRVDN